MMSFFKLGAEESESVTAEFALVVTMALAALLLAIDAAGADSGLQAAGVPVLQALVAGGLLVAVGLIGHARYRWHHARHSVDALHCGPDLISEPPHNPNFQKRQEIQRMLLRHFDAAVNNRIEVRHIMSRTVRTVAPTAAVIDLKCMMRSEGIHHLLVIKQGLLVGVISDRDVKSRRGRTAQHIMTASPVTVTPGTNVSRAITMMLHRRFSCLPVIEKGEIRGILTDTDMMMTLQCLMKLLDRVDQPTEPAEDLLASMDDLGDSIAAAAGYTAG